MLNTVENAHSVLTNLTNIQPMGTTVTMTHPVLTMPQPMLTTTAHPQSSLSTGSAQIEYFLPDGKSKGMYRETDLCK